MSVEELTKKEKEEQAQIFSQRNWDKRRRRQIRNKKTRKKGLG